MSHGPMSAGTAPHGMLAAHALADGVDVLTAITAQRDVSATPSPKTVAIVGTDLLFGQFMLPSIDVVRPKTRLTCKHRFGFVPPDRSYGLSPLESNNLTAPVLKVGENLWANLVSEATTPPLRVTDYKPLSLLECFKLALRAYEGILAPERLLAFTRQLTSLLVNEEDFREAGIQPSLGSFRGLTEFLRLNSAFKHPNLSIDATGRFVASWTPYRRAKLSLTFAGTAGGTWIATDRANGEKDQASGSFQVSDVKSISQKFASWMDA